LLQPEKYKQKQLP